MLIANIFRCIFRESKSKQKTAFQQQYVTMHPNAIINKNRTNIFITLINLLISKKFINFASFFDYGSNFTPNISNIAFIKPTFFIFN